MNLGRNHRIYSATGDNYESVAFYLTVSLTPSNTGVKHCSLFFYMYICLLIYFWLCWVFIAARGLSLVAVSRGYSVAVHRFLIAVASLAAQHRL